MYLSGSSAGREAHSKIQELDAFLAGIEKRAFRIAQLAVGNHEDALDIVQDAMLKLSQNYADKSTREWKPLFYRILENRIMDFHRKENLRRKWFWWKSETADQAGSEAWFSDDGINQPLEAIQQVELGQNVLVAIKSLPVKQQQCFLLRCWEGLSVKETATAMNVSEGSIKTHFSRAMQKLQTVIADHE